MSHFRACGERAEHELAEMFGVAHRDVYEIVVGTRKVKHAPHFGQRDDVLFEATDRIPRVLGESHGDQRFQRHAMHTRIHLGVVAEDRSGLFQSPYAGETAGRRQPDPRRQHLVGEPCIVLQKRQNLAIDSVNRRRR